MNFTNSHYEKMMKEIPRPCGADRCAGCRYIRECRGKNGRCLKRLRPLTGEPRTSGRQGPNS